MILIEQSLCWTDMRKVGIFYSFINIILKVGVLILAAQIFEHVLLVAACFSGLYMFLHIMLICGLYSRKPSILMWWLAFAPFQIIALQAILLYINIFLFLLNLESWVGILISLGHLVLTIFMFHNVCVVYSAQYSFKNNEDGQNRNYGNNISTAMRQPTADPPYISMKA